jgi:hypothetical protein
VNCENGQCCTLLGVVGIFGVFLGFISGEPLRGLFLERCITESRRLNGRFLSGRAVSSVSPGARLAMA